MASNGEEGRLINVPKIMDGTWFALSKTIGKTVVAECLICPNKFLSAHMGSTSNLLKHLRKKHKAEYEKYIEQRTNRRQSSSVATKSAEDGTGTPNTLKRKIFIPISSPREPKMRKVQNVMSIPMSSIDNFDHHHQDKFEEVESLECLLKNNIPQDDLKKVWSFLYGRELKQIKFEENVLSKCILMNLELEGFEIRGKPERIRPPRITRVGLIQHKIVLETTEPIDKQRDAIMERVGEILDVAGHNNVNVVCLQECWTSPFFMCTREKDPWLELAEDALTGPSTKMLSEFAKTYNMVIISPILERDEINGDQIFNTAVVISNTGKVIGKTRKNHIPRVGDFNESSYYIEGDMGHAVFDTCYGKLGVNICYGRHHPQNWMAYGLNGAEIVFNPSATVSGLSEPLWPIEARNAAVANSYYACAVNRVGTEVYPHEFTSGDKKPAHKEFGHFYGSSYVAAPDGCRTPGLSRLNDGLLVVDCDLNLCRQVKDNWGFRMTQRLPLYADLLTRASRQNFEPQIIRDLSRTDEDFKIGLCDNDNYNDDTSSFK
ncbi:hypothetical protein HELRODRAFT_110857 [Helobdella robusta]|uniref:Beta-ureidopropionase n=1 Tax=Helobdella robusta TaxID=6412 RepID=T1EF57_HELRO|nr:hypothetical protein HELRODRAFT_110857 [Helobdella robusta]ESO06773.1 hypothetical protein HELRODRAFT_110857 [Helobdella robusta]